MPQLGRTITRYANHLFAKEGFHGYYGSLAAGIAASVPDVHLLSAVVRLGHCLCLRRGFFVASVRFGAAVWPLLLLLFPTHLASTISASLPDYPADKACSKRTAAVRLSPKTARRWVLVLQAISIALFHVTAVVSSPCTVLISIVPLMSLVVMARIHNTAEAGSTNLFYFVAFSILGVLSYVAGLIVYLAF